MHALMIRGWYFTSLCSCNAGHVMYKITPSLSYLYTIWLTIIMLGIANAHAMVNGIPMVLIYVVTNWPGM